MRLPVPLELHPVPPAALRSPPGPTEREGERETMAAPNLAKVDWKRKENTLSHHTDQYNTQELVVRRGQAFAVTLTFQGGTRPSGNLTCIVETGPTPALQAKTRVAFAVTRTPRSGSWSGIQTASDAGSVTISISSPPNAIIGRYALSVTTGSGSSAPATSLGTFALLFNPWLAADDVFMPNNAEREEYVLSEFGLVFMGSANRIGQTGWNFGQFQDGILDICLALLDRSRSFIQDANRDLTQRNDPRHVGRVLSAMVNSNDDSGVLQGNWSGSYRGGQNPSSWTGSVDILRQWKASGYKAVKYGQCWVFAGVLTTDRSLTVDVYYDASGNPLNAGADSIWNFHVWNESWFVRPDIGSALQRMADPRRDSRRREVQVGGSSSEVYSVQLLAMGPVRAVEMPFAVPGAFLVFPLAPLPSGRSPFPRHTWLQEEPPQHHVSSGLFQCGPASLTAIKEGDVDLRYDGPFVFAEVNADQVTWAYDESMREAKRIYTETKSVGQFTSTKAVGSYARVDVTSNYKYPEGSAKEKDGL
ncbi:UNVERIFIED_CONTAM: hypothetical protein K2H54_073266 [Gekko kuhli]